MTTTGAAPIRIAGHAYRPTRNKFGWNVTPGCECGAHLLGWSVTGKTARDIHREHKRQAIRALEAGK